MLIAYYEKLSQLYVLKLCGLGANELKFACLPNKFNNFTLALPSRDNVVCGSEEGLDEK